MFSPVFLLDFCTKQRTIAKNKNNKEKSTMKNQRPSKKCRRVMPVSNIPAVLTAADYIEQAKKARAVDDDQAARINFANALSLNSDNVTIYLDIIDCCVSLELWKEVALFTKKIFERIAKSKGDESEKRDLIKVALLCYQKLMVYLPDDGDLYAKAAGDYIGQARRDRGVSNYQAARINFANALRLNPNNMTTYLDIIDACHQLALEKEIALFTKKVFEYLDKSEADNVVENYRRCAKESEDRDLTNVALLCYQKLMVYLPDDGDLCINAADCLIELGWYFLAEYYVKKAKTIPDLDHDGAEESYHNIIRGYVDDKDEHAIRLSHELVSIISDNGRLADAYAELGKFFYERGFLSFAEKMFSKMAKLGETILPHEYKLLHKNSEMRKEPGAMLLEEDAIDSFWSQDRDPAEQTRGIEADLQKTLDGEREQKRLKYWRQIKKSYKNDGISRKPPKAVFSYIANQSVNNLEQFCHPRMLPLLGEIYQAEYNGTNTAFSDRLVEYYRQQAKTAEEKIDTDESADAFEDIDNALTEACFYAETPTKKALVTEDCLRHAKNHAAKNRDKEAIAYYKKAIELNPDHVPSYIEVATLVARQTKNWSNAQVILEEVVKLELSNKQRAVVIDCFQALVVRYNDNGEMKNSKDCLSYAANLMGCLPKSPVKKAPLLTHQQIEHQIANALSAIKTDKNIECAFVCLGKTSKGTLSNDQKERIIKCYEDLSNLCVSFNQLGMSGQCFHRITELKRVLSDQSAVDILFALSNQPLSSKKRKRTPQKRKNHQDSPRTPHDSPGKGHGSPRKMQGSSSNWPQKKPSVARALFISSGNAAPSSSSASPNP
jgi:tetratricopeptide (TPR) repeat protein